MRRAGRERVVRWLSVLALAALVAGTLRAQSALPAATSAPDAAGISERLGAAARARALARITNKYDPWFKKYTKRYFGPAGDWRLFKAQGVAESELNPRAVSRVGARGLMQLMPATFGLVAANRSWMTSIDSPEANIAAGLLHDRDLWVLWTPRVDDTERPRFMFASYNAGEGTIFRAIGVAKASNLDATRWENIAQVAPTVRNWRHAETLGYVEKIEGTYSVLRSAR